MGVESVHSPPTVSGEEQWKVTDLKPRADNTWMRGPYPAVTARSSCRPPRLRPTGAALISTGAPTCC